MSRKDYELIARVLARFAKMETPMPIGATTAAITESLAMSLAMDNPHFKRDRFLAAVDVPAKYFEQPRDTVAA